MGGRRFLSGAGPIPFLDVLVTSRVRVVCQPGVKVSLKYVPLFHNLMMLLGCVVEPQDKIL